MTEKRFTLADEYLIAYDGDYFDLHKPSDIRSLINVIRYVTDENEQLKQLIKKVLETTPIEHSLAMDLKNSIRELYE